jgi:hypothetical protein
MIPLDQINKQNTLGEARAALRVAYIKGANCPCCKQFVKLYKRTISSSMAAGLCMVARAKTVGEPFHLESFFRSVSPEYDVGGDFAKVRFWDFIESIEGLKEDGNPDNGMYKLTESGRRFVYDKVETIKYVWIFANKVREYGKDQYVTIHDCLQRSNKFDYDKLMSGTL